jgi:hypothetical protein
VTVLPPGCDKAVTPRWPRFRPLRRFHLSRRPLPYGLDEIEDLRTIEGLVLERVLVAKGHRPGRELAQSGPIQGQLDAVLLDAPSEVSDVWVNG